MVFLEPGISSNIILKEKNSSWIQNNNKTNPTMGTDNEEIVSQVTTKEQ